MLGHRLAFSYCRAPGRDVPCGKIVDCWWREFDIKAFLEAHFTPDQVNTISAPKQDKAVTIYELIKQAQDRAEQADGQ